MNLADMHRSLLPITIVVLLAAVFLVDVLTPLGYAEWALYMIPVGLTLLQRRPLLPFHAAAVAAVLTLIGLYMSPGGMDLQRALVNRAIGITLLTALSFAIHQALRVRQEMQALLALQKSEAAVAQTLLGEQTPEQIGRNATRALCEQLGAQIGAAYRLDGRSLRLSGGHAIDGALAAASFELPNGLPGQVAVDGRARLVAEVPAEHLPLVSALGRSTPARLIVAPLRADGIVNGVIELGFCGGSASLARELAMVEASSESIGVALRTALYREQLMNLLAETQRQSEELQTQQEELRVSNEELESQSRVLSESQARLEAQQIELEQTNVQLEEQKESLERQKQYLVQAQAGLRANAEQLEEASRYKSEFLANMSHELRTPLNSALILSKLLADNREGSLSAEQVKYAQTIHAANNDLLALINDVLDLSKIEAGHVELAPERIETADLLQRLRAIFEPLAQQKAVAFRVEADAAAPAAIFSDPMRLQQVLKNLLANALKFTARGAVRLMLRPLAEGRIAFEVHDTGVGIPKAQQEVIFEAFRQADGSTSRRFGGTGLGLSISRELARRLGGDIGVSSEPGAGSVFTLELPIELVLSGEAANGARPAPAANGAAAAVGKPAPVAPSAAASKDAAGKPASRTATPAKPAAAPVTPPAASETNSAASLQRQHPGRLILAVEDDPGFARVLADLARELSFDCAIAATGEEALRMAAELKPSGILLDVGLPDQSGLGVLERLKRDPATRHIPVHVVSAHPHVRTARELGAVGYLQKPATRDALAEVLERLQQHTQQTVRRLLIVEDDVPLRENLQLLLGGEQVEITAVGSIAEALQQLAGATFDCMVTDLALPDGSGYELLERISQGDEYAFPPVIVYTGRALSRDEEQRLRRYSKSIIVKGARSPERLLDEVTLFLHSVEASLPPSQQSLLRQARQRDAVLDGRRILLAEDDVRNIFALSSVFEPLGARLVIARNGREALQKLEADAGIDLVLMDIMMPEMDGLTAMRKIRERSDWAALPVIALTAKAMPDDRERCLEAGASDYIAKPIDVDKLISLARVWMPK